MGRILNLQKLQTASKLSDLDQEAISISSCDSQSC